MKIQRNSFLQPAENIHLQMASHLEDLARVLRDGANLGHLTRDEQLGHVKFALAEHHRAIVEDD